MCCKLVLWPIAFHGGHEELLGLADVSSRYLEHASHLIMGLTAALIPCSLGSQEVCSAVCCLCVCQWYGSFASRVFIGTIVLCHCRQILTYRIVEISCMKLSAL